MIALPKRNHKLKASTRLFSYQQGNSMKLFAVMLFLCSVLVGLLVACRPASDSPAPLPDVPDYPDAQLVDTEPVQTTGGKSAQSWSFLTSDHPDNVLSFYHNVLTEQGWEFQKEAEIKGNRFLLIQGCQLSILDIVTERNRTGRTIVSLDLTSSFCG